MTAPLPSSGCRASLVAASLTALLLFGCAVGPDYQRPPVTTPPAEWKAAAQWQPARPRDTDLRQKFWEVFEDPILNGLEEQASTNSPDLRAAFERVEQARAVARIAKADLFPNLKADPNANRSRYSPNRVAPPDATAVAYTANDFSLPLDLSYEVDLWGRVRRSFRSARAQAQAGAAAFQSLMLSLQANVAQTYFMIRSLDLNRRVVGEAIVLRRKNLALVGSLHEGGAGTAVDVAQAGTELASAEADLIGLELRRRQLENALGVLCGQPASSFTLAQSPRLYRPPAIPIALPADLLERRPDVAEAERSLAAASESIGIAKAAFFPAIHLTGAAGVESMDLKDLFSWDSRVWSLGPSLSLPLFEGGRNRAGLLRARAAYEEAVARYRSQVLVAFREVEDGLAGLRLLTDQFNTQMRAVEGAQKVAELSRNRYQEGLASYFEVVLADRTVLENQITAYGLNGQRMVTMVQLIKALGGGWRTERAVPAGDFSPLPPAR